VSRRLARALLVADKQAFASVARYDNAGIDQVVPRLTNGANHGVLWFGVAGALALTGTGGRRAAARGLMSMGIASAVANGPAKWAVRRTRPLLTDVPPLRQLARQPRTTSFPSGHSASAAAFATGVLLESPARALPVVVIAAGVAYGRVHIGVHYPSDVAAGIALGAVSAVVVRRVWPTRPVASGAAEAGRCEAPALPDGDGLVVVVNAGAESTGAVADELCAQVSDALPKVEVVRCDDPGRIQETLQDAARRARVLGVAGGDGTVSCAAGIAVAQEVPLVVLPAGTLNHFAGELGVNDGEGALKAVAEGSAVSVTVAQAGEGLPFLNTFSLGLYPELVHRREAREKLVGKWPALALALIEVLRSAEPTDIEVDSKPRRVWLLFGGNGRYHPSGFAPSWRERLDEDVVDVRIVDAKRRWARTRLVAAVLTGRLGRCRVYEERTVDEMRIRFLDPEPALARDGETQPAPTELTLRAADHRLVVYRP
jgi:diacylglycerol kinase family enzyme/membrane-associated phospholipid phosphatase